jgi:hypothetical protein
MSQLWSIEVSSSVLSPASLDFHFLAGAVAVITGTAPDLDASDQARLFIQQFKVRAEGGAVACGSTSPQAAEAQLNGNDKILEQAAMQAELHVRFAFPW